MNVLITDHTDKLLLYTPALCSALTSVFTEVGFLVSKQLAPAFDVIRQAFGKIEVFLRFPEKKQYDAVLEITSPGFECSRAYGDVPRLRLILPGAEQTTIRMEAVSVGNRILFSSELSVTDTRLPFPPAVDIRDLLLRLLTPQDLQSIRFLITAGPTAEDIDPVRFLSNRSTGKMGIALARAAFIRGGQVELICGPVSEDLPHYIDCRQVRSAAEMAETVFDRFTCCDVYIGSAAVADYTPREIAAEKIKKRPGDLELPLKRTTDILAELKNRKTPDQFMIGFSVETWNERENSMVKMKNKDLDMIVINNPRHEGAAFALDTNRVTLLSRKGDEKELPLLTKIQTAHRIYDYMKDVLTDR